MAGLPNDGQDLDKWKYTNDVEGNEHIPDINEGQYNMLVNVQVVLPHYNRQLHALVLGRHKRNDGSMIGQQDINHMHGIDLCDVQFLMGFEAIFGKHNC